MRVLILAATMILGACAGARSQPILSKTAVSSVSGIHAGKCSPKRTEQVARILQSVTVDDMVDKGRVCPCSPKYYSELVSNGRNMLSVRLRPGTPLPWAVPPKPNIELIFVQKGSWPVNAPRGVATTMLWLGYRNAGELLFGGIELRGDPFDIARHEC
jgi:hypothetical protein